MAQKAYKILIIGNGGVGKTTFIRRHRTGEFEEKYIATMGVAVNPLPFNTNMGTVYLNLWDCAGKPEFMGLRDGYYIGADAAIIMFDVCNPASYACVPSLVREVRKIRPNIHLVICGNKVDKHGRSVRPSHITIPKRFDIQYYDVSAKSNYNFEKPFLYLLRKLRGDETLAFA
jgi:GTP-binding nuclear protein Ran